MVNLSSISYESGSPSPDMKAQFCADTDNSLGSLKNNAVDKVEERKTSIKTTNKTFNEPREIGSIKSYERRAHFLYCIYFFSDFFCAFWDCGSIFSTRKRH
jgi:hypothetical protein